MNKICISIGENREDFPNVREDLKLHIVLLKRSFCSCHPPPPPPDYLLVLIFALIATVQPENLAAVEEMSMETLEKEINQGLEEIAKREEVFVIVIDAINQVTRS